MALEVSVSSDKTDLREALDFANSLRSASSLCVTAPKEIQPSLVLGFFCARRSWMRELMPLQAMKFV
jgi:hypothetical protein